MKNITNRLNLFVGMVLVPLIICLCGCNQEKYFMGGDIHDSTVHSKYVDTASFRLDWIEGDSFALLKEERCTDLCITSALVGEIQTNSISFTVTTTEDTICTVPRDLACVLFNGGEILIRKFLKGQVVPVSGKYPLQVFKPESYFSLYPIVFEKRFLFHEGHFSISFHSELSFFLIFVVLMLIIFVVSWQIVVEYQRVRMNPKYKDDIGFFCIVICICIVLLLFSIVSISITILGLLSPLILQRVKKARKGDIGFRGRGRSEQV